MTKDGNNGGKTNIIRRILTLLAASLLLTACSGDNNSEEETYRQYGINCLDNGKYPEAVEAFQNALNRAHGRVGETELDICFYKARAQYLSGDLEAAMDTYNSVILYNDDARAYFLRGKLLYNIGEQEKALEDFSAAVKRDEANYELLIGIYELLSQNGQAESGLEYLEQALKVKGETATDCLYKGRIHFLFQDYDQAAEYLRKALEGDEIKAAFYLGQICDAQGDLENSAKYIRMYLDSGSATAYELCELGNEEMSDGDYTQALVYYNEGLKMETVPNRQNLMKNAIVAYEYSGDFKSARSLIEEYLKLYPSDEDAQRESIFLQTR